ncbi:hypothetical protein [Macrococcus capreoli]|uniref:hypothetical protein n=1 Tax=Macrococcus capreoli TaxID=2982690 RepID=UPI0021D5D761|nr:hypothetical protein [Macrococcus sp. TMW 2.2395]MCU7557267.1 hypothetical protein [Macrococcus sp. TMW 2.2395]
MYTPNEIRQMLKDYPWMLTAIEADLLSGDSTSIAQYGIDSTMPKTKGTTSDKVYNQILKREHTHNYIKKLAIKVKFIDEHENMITNDKDIYILQLLKRGYSHTQIGLLVRLHKSQVGKRVDKIVELFSNASKKSNTTKATK